MNNSIVISTEFEDSSLDLLRFFCDMFPVSIMDIGFVCEMYCYNIINELGLRGIINKYKDRQDIIEQEIRLLIDGDDVVEMEDLALYELSSSFNVDTYTSHGRESVMSILSQMENISGIVSSYYIIDNGTYVSDYELHEVLGIIYSELIYGIFTQLIDNLTTVIMLLIHNDVYVADVVIYGRRLMVVFEVGKKRIQNDNINFF